MRIIDVAVVGDGDHLHWMTLLEMLTMVGWVMWPLVLIISTLTLVSLGLEEP